MTVDRPRGLDRAPWCYYNTSCPVHVQARFLVRGRLIDPLSNRVGQLIDPLSDSARPRPVLNQADRFIIRLTS